MTFNRGLFTSLIVDRLLPAFTQAPPRIQTDYHFVVGSLDQITDFDAAWFMRTIELRILTEVDGDFRTARSTANERIFNHGPKSESPRRLRIAVEAIIGIGAIGRLIVEHGWSPEQLSLQPEGWAFDLATYDRSGTLAIVGEMKTKSSEVDGMCDHFERAFATDASRVGSGNLNWDRKVAWFRGQRATVLWGLGPNGHERIYKVRDLGGSGEQTVVRGSAKDLHLRS